TLTLGLDLQGGSHILLALEREDLVEERLKATRDDVRNLLREERIGYTGLSGSGKVVQVRIRDAEQIEAARSAVDSLLQPVQVGLFGGGMVTEVEFAEPEPGLFRFTLTEEGIDY